MKITKNAIEFHIDTVDELANLEGKDKQVCIVSDEDRGGIFVYNSDRVSENDAGVVFNGWVRKYDGPVNVKWFGAIGDGKTDDTEAIQKAINKYTKVCLSPNKIYCHKGLVLENVVFNGGMSTLLAIDTLNNNYAITIKNNVNMFKCIIDNIYTGSRLSTTTSQAVAVNGSNITIENNIIKKSAAGGIYINNSTNYKIINNEVYNTLADGIHNTNGCSNGNITNNYVHNTGDDCIAVVSYNSNVNICKDINIISNKVNGNAERRGISVVGGFNITISLNNIKNTIAGSYIASEASYDTNNCENIIVSNNNIISSGSDTLGLSNINVLGRSNYILNNISITENICTDANNNGIMFCNVSNLNIYNNIIKGDTTTCNRFIFIKKGVCDNIFINDNIFNTCKSYGMSTENDQNINNIVLKNNTFINVNISNTSYVDLINITDGGNVIGIKVIGNILKNSNVERYIEAHYDNICFVDNTSINSTQHGTAVNSLLKYTPNNYSLSYRGNVPTSGDYNKGSIIFNTNTTIQNIGWMCVSSGNPGTWKPFGFITDKGDNINMNNLPTSDPEVEGQLWNDNGTVKVSAG